jgi:hypothetical protein
MNGADVKKPETGSTSTTDWGVNFLLVSLE